MTSFILNRFIQSIITLFLISICVFLLIHATPGDPIIGAIRQPRITPERIEQLREQYGLNDPLPVRYVKWFGNLLKGDLGYSFFSRRPVMTEISDRFINTVYLMFSSFLLSLLVAIPIGIFSAVKQYSFFDILATFSTLFGQAIPEFLSGIILISIFYGLLSNPWTGDPLLPAGGMYSLNQDFSIVDRLTHLILPVTTLALAWVSWYSRFLRASMLDILHKPYIVAARARGVKERIIALKHAFRNAVLPLVTLIALDLPYLFGGTLYVEIVFSWPGIGRLFYDAATKRDYPVLIAITMILAFLTVLCNFIADVAYSKLDPRIRLHAD
jgi:peptide/nickel transport system permease protein